MRTTVLLVVAVLGAGGCAVRSPSAGGTVVVAGAEPREAVVVQVDQTRPRRSRWNKGRAVTTLLGAAAGGTAGALLGWYTAALGCECSEHEDAFMIVGAAAGAAAGAVAGATAGAEP